MDPDAKPKTPRVVITASALAGALRTDPREVSGDLSPSAPHWPLIPGYRLVRLIGEGGGGRVFEAVREGGSRMPVALKVVRQPLGTSGRGSGMDRVWRELDLLSELRLECVPRVVDWGTVDGRMYIATELVQGESLQEYCDRSRLTLRGRVEMLVEVCRAVASVHDALVVHRDLKPSNILVDGKGKPVIVDFGVARLATDEPGETVTVTGEVVGTTAFIAPEVACSQPGALRSVQADVYSLGATAYVILTGQPPREEKTTAFERLREAGEGRTRDPRALNPKIPRPLGAVLCKVCEREPSRRYASAREFGDDLRRWAEDKPVMARRTTWMRGTDWAAQHPIRTTFLGFAALVAASIGSTTYWYSRYVSQPDRVIVQRDSEGVELVSKSGVVLKSWQGTRPRDVVFGGVASAGDGSKRIGVLALGPGVDDLLATRLIAFDFADYQRPLLVSGIGAPDFVRPTGTVEGDRYRVAWANIADVFPEIPGDEFVAIFNEHTFYPSCIRIYSAKGTKLYEIWHRGRLQSAQWLAKHGVLVVAGVSNQPEVDAAAAKAVKSGSHVPIVFGLCPHIGEKKRWLVTTGTKDTALAWYKYLRPLEARVWLQNARVDPTIEPEDRDNRAVLFATGAGSMEEAHVRWLVRADGRIDSRAPSDVYAARADVVPAGELWWSDEFVDARAPVDGAAPENVPGSP